MATVYYDGSEEDWNKITIEQYNDPLISATRVAYIPVTSVSLDQSAVSYAIEEGNFPELVSLQATVLPENATFKNILFSSDNSSVASIGTKTTEGNRSTVQITVNGIAGIAHVRALTVVGGYSDTCEVIVEPSDSEFVVSFDSNGGSTVESQMIKWGEKVVKPLDPTKAGATFAGWYINEALTEEYNFDNTVTKTITLYAKWIEESGLVTVTFNTTGGSAIPEQTVEKGKTIEKPSDPVRAGYTFDGWYTDSIYTHLFSFRTEITDNLTLFAKWIKSQSGNSFILQHDNNHFANSSSNFFNAGDFRNYQFKNKMVYDKLLGLSKDGNVDYTPTVQGLIAANWGGSCYGIASTMALVKAGKLSIGDLTKTNVANYHALSAPRTDKELFDVINFYQVGQVVPALNRETKIAEVQTRDDANALKTFLQQLVKSTEGGNSIVFCYYYNGLGHAILALDSRWDEENRQYIVTMYDENTANGIDNRESEYLSEMIVAEDYSTFSYVPVNGSFDLRNVYSGLRINDPKKYPVFSEIGSEAMNDLLKQEAGEGYVFVSLPGDSESEIRNYEGKSLILKDGEVSGDMSVYDEDYIFADEASRILLKVAESDSYSVVSNDVNIVLTNSEKCMGLSGESIDGADISFKDNTINAKGNNFGFDAWILLEDSQSMLSLSGNAEKDTEITAERNTIRAVSAGNLSDIASVTYTGNESINEKVETKGNGEVEATHIDISDSGMNPIPKVLDNSIGLVKNQIFELGTGNWSISGNNGAIALSKKKGISIITAKKASITPATVINGDIKYNVYVIDPKVVFSNGLASIKALVGDTVEVRVSGIPDSLKELYSISWSTSKPEVASPDILSGSPIFINANGKGSANIISYICGRTYKASINVNDDVKSVPKTIGSSAEMIKSGTECYSKI